MGRPFLACPKMEHTRKMNVKCARRQTRAFSSKKEALDRQRIHITQFNGGIGDGVTIDIYAESFVVEYHLCRTAAGKAGPADKAKSTEVGLDNFGRKARVLGDKTWDAITVWELGWQGRPSLGLRSAPVCLADLFGYRTDLRPSKSTLHPNVGGEAETCQADVRA